MAKQATNTAALSWEQMMDLLETNKGIAKTDSSNIMKNIIEVGNEFVTEHVEAGKVENITVETPLSTHHIMKKAAEERVDAKTGTRYGVPERWVGGVSAINAFVDTANNGIEMKRIPIETEDEKAA